MKKFSLSVFITVLAILGIVTGAFAQSGQLPGSGWWTAEQIQNVSGASAQISVVAYDAATNNSYTTVQQTVANGGSFTFLPEHFTNLPTGFQGSAVVSASGAIKAIVNVTNRVSGSLGVTGGQAAAQYQGVDSTMVANDLYFPLVKGDHFGKTTTFFVQNAGGTAVTATATFTMRNGDVHVYTTPSIGPNKMVAFTVTDSSTWIGSVANDGKVGALKVTATQPLAGTVLEHNTVDNPAKIAQATRAFTAADFDDKAYAPIIKNTRFGRFTGIQVQNVSGAAIDITVSYKGTAGACNGNTYTDTATGILNNAAKTFINLPGQSNLPADCTAAATISATGNFVAVVNEAYVSTMIPATGQSAVTSSAIPDKMATAKISAPLFKDDRLSKRTGLQVQNVGGATATNVVATFVCTGATGFTAVTKPQTITSGAGMLFMTPSSKPDLFATGTPFPSNNVVCAVTITADQPIVAIANESVTPNMGLVQDNNNYEAFNLAP